MPNRIKNRVKASYAAKRYADRGNPRGGQGKPRITSTDKRATRKSIGTRQVKKAYAKRVKAS